MIKLREITRDNFDDCLFLNVNKTQEDFVASTMYSLAEAKVFTENIPLAIYHDNTMVGFLMYQSDYNDGAYWITRLLIDKKYQKLGYGTEAMKLIIPLIIEENKTDTILISFDPENLVVEKLYLSLGFKHTGRIEDEEVVMEYKI